MDPRDPSFQASQVGIMGALRTGNPIVDMVFAMLVPVVIKKMFDVAAQQDMGEAFNFFFFWSRYYTRDIEHKTVQVSWGGTFSTDKDLRNNVLIKAITLFLDQERKLEYRNSSVLLQSTKTNDSPWPWDRGEDEAENTPAGKLKSFKVAKKPPKNKWCPVTEKGAAHLVELRVIEHEHDKGEKAEKTTMVNVYSFRSRDKAAIDDFIDTCYKWYIEQLKKMEDNSRYLYEMQACASPPARFPHLLLAYLLLFLNSCSSFSLTSLFPPPAAAPPPRRDLQVNPGSKASDSEESASRVFKRYKLSDAKTFDSLFFDEKKRLLAQVTHFTAKSGKYAVSGYPHKLGLLLHGPPGTGKTSLIKALAQHTGRSIVNVPLARIQTNQELMDIMFDQSYMVMGDDVPIKLGFKDVIFVMEDVDAGETCGWSSNARAAPRARCSSRALLLTFLSRASLTRLSRASLTPSDLPTRCSRQDCPAARRQDGCDRARRAALAADGR